MPGAFDLDVPRWHADPSTPIGDVLGRRFTWSDVDSGWCGSAPPHFGCNAFVGSEKAPGWLHVDFENGRLAEGLIAMTDAAGNSDAFVATRGTIDLQRQRMALDGLSYLGRCENGRPGDTDLVRSVID